MAVCGLAGGSGTSTLALGLARQAAAESSAPVLIADAAGPIGGLAQLSGGQSTHSLNQLARTLAVGSPPRQAFTEFSSGLRLIATAPATTETSPDGAIETLLDQAREVHGLVVVDCGTYWLADPTPLACADRVVWTMTATDVGFAAAGALLASGAVPRPPVGGEALVARHIPAVAGAKVRALRRLARDRRGRLVLMAHDNGGATQDPPCEVVLRALSGIAPTLRAGTR